MVKYLAVFTKQSDGTYAVDFPECEGLFTQADTLEEAPTMARDALLGWLEADLAQGHTPPQPKRGTALRSGGRSAWVAVPPKLAITLSFRWAREAAGLTQAQLAKRVGVSQQQIAKLEHPDANPSIDTLIKVAAALGRSLDVKLPPANERA
jgi:antitoxin HicB